MIRHRFYGNDSEILVVDEWPDEESFNAFFQASPEIAGYMDAAGVTSEPEIRSGAFRAHPVAAGRERYP